MSAILVSPDLQASPFPELNESLWKPSGKAKEPLPHIRSKLLGAVYTSPEAAIQGAEEQMAVFTSDGLPPQQVSEQEALHSAREQGIAGIVIMELRAGKLVELRRVYVE